tara:strand:+ start:317 stop:1027 length:711 start_codon:yes stop_codon:yes gene_type:complete
MYLVIPACKNFYLSLRQSLNILQPQLRTDDKVIVVNLGMTKKQMEFLTSRNYKQIEYFNIDWSIIKNKWKKDLQNYWFKSAIWSGLLNRKIKDIVLIIDSACIIYNNISTIETLINKNIIYSPYSDADIKKWVHPKSQESIGFTLPDNLHMVSGGCLGVNLDHPVGNAFIEDFIKCCNNKDTLCPDGSNKSNHRQDQSVLTMLYHLYHMKYKFNIVKEWINIDYHKGIWNHELTYF